MTRFEVWKRKKARRENQPIKSTGLHLLVGSLKQDLIESGYYS